MECGFRVAAAVFRCWNPGGVVSSRSWIVPRRPRVLPSCTHRSRVRCAIPDRFSLSLTMRVVVTRGGLIPVSYWLLFFVPKCVTQENYGLMETPEPSCPCLDDVHGFLQAKAPDFFSQTPGQCDGLADLTGYCLPLGYGQVSVVRDFQGYNTRES